MAEVRLERLHKRIGASAIIPDLTLTVRDGEFFTLVGPSGCGKSTLLHLIAGLETPTSGRILFDGQDVTGLAPRERDIALVFQNYALYPHMTVSENLAFPLKVGPRTEGYDRATIEREVQRVADLLGLAPLLERRPRELSGGQRQRVALGRALIRRPSVFLLDEPLSNLDAQLRAGMRAELRRLHDQFGITMIYVTHDQTEAMTLADRLAVLDHGQLRQIGTPHKLYAMPDNVFVAGFIGHPPMNLFEARLESGEAVTGSIRVPLPPDILRHHDVVMVGIRPEDICVRAVNAPEIESAHQRALAGESVTGTVRLIEHTGGQVWVTCEVQPIDRPVSVQATEAMTLVGLTTGGFQARPGDRVFLSMEKAVLHLFDVQTGSRLGGEMSTYPIDLVTSPIRHE